MSGSVWAAAAEASAVSCCGTIALALAGGVLARTKLTGGRGSIRDMTSLVVYFFCPCMIISGLADSLTLDSLLDLWLLPAVSIVIVCVGALIGLVVCSALGVAARDVPVVICCCACGNAFALPLSMAQALALNVEWIGALGGPLMQSYVFVYCLTDSLVLFGPVNFALGWHPASDAAARNQDEEQSQLMTAPLSPAAAAAPQGKGGAEGGALRHVRTALGSLANPMMVASVAGMVLSLIEPLRARYVQSSLFQSMAFSGAATTPLMLANLGAGMALHMREAPKGKERLPRRLVAAVVLGRLVLCPLATLGVLAAAVQLGIVPGSERLLLLFLLMQGATPSAMFLGVICQVGRPPT